MTYQGGKFRAGKRIAALIDTSRSLAYVEPFCGALGVMRHMGDRGIPRIGLDANQALITMWNAALAGWKAPLSVSEAEYQRVKLSRDPLDPMTAFVGAGCSFAGKWFGGYARNAEGRDYAGKASRSISEIAAKCAGVSLAHRDYRLFVGSGCTVYCDPPYAGTTGYAGVGAWDQDAFNRWVDATAKRNRVYLSEYMMPAGLRGYEVAQFGVGCGIARGDARKAERLFRIE